MNKRGQLGSQIMIFPFLFLLIVVSVGIVAGVGLFFGGEYDFRQVDAEVLSFKSERCILNLERFNGEINWNEFFDICEIDEKVMKGNDLILKICEGKTDCILENNALVEVGSNFQTCRFEGAKENDNFPKCSFNKFEVNGKEYQIISGSNQRIQRGVRKI